MAVEVTNNGQFSRAFKVSGGFVEVKPGETATLEPLFPIPEIDDLAVKEVKATNKKAAASDDPPQG